MEQLKEKQELALNEYSKKIESDGKPNQEKFHNINLLKKSIGEKFDSADYFMKLDKVKAKAHELIQLERQKKLAEVKN